MSQVLDIRRETRDTAPPGAALANVFAAMDRAGIEYCVLNGLENWPHPSDSDVDFVMEGKALPERLYRLLVDEGPSLGVEVAQWLRDAAHFIVLVQHSSHFLQLHAAADCVLRQRVLYTGDEVLDTRRHNGAFWVPATSIECAFYLAKRIVKGRIDAHHERRLSDLYRQDPRGCEREVSRIWSKAGARRINSALDSGQWDVVNSQLGGLRADLLRRVARRRPLSFVRRGLFAIGRRARRWFIRDRGLSVVLLGVDGSGKSSVVEALRQDLAPAFSATYRHSFPPAWRQPDGVKTNSSPHDVPPRSYGMSILRAIGYWLIHYSLVYYFTARRAMCRNALILHDRHMVDALVDPIRYRHGGPGWLLRWICRLIPRPDLIILLDAPVDVAQSRKQEVSRDEVARQRLAYRTLVESWPQARIVDAARPLADVVAEVRDVVCRHLAERVQTAFGKRRVSDAGCPMPNLDPGGES